MFPHSAARFEAISLASEFLFDVIVYGFGEVVLSADHRLTLSSTSIWISRRPLFLPFGNVTSQYSLIAFSANGMRFTSPLAINRRRI